MLRPRRAHSVEVLAHRAGTPANRSKPERKFRVVKPWRVAQAGLLQVIDPRSARADKAKSLNTYAHPRAQECTITMRLEKTQLT